MERSSATTLVANNEASTPLAATPIFYDPWNTTEQRGESDKVIVIPPSNVLFDHVVATTTAPATSTAAAPSSTIGTNETTLASVRPLKPDMDNSEPPSEGEPRTFKGKVVKAKNAHLPDEVLAFRERRQCRTKVATWTGGAVGLATIGPLGAVVCGAGAYAAAKSVGKRRERALLNKCTGGVASIGAVAPEMATTTTKALTHSAQLV